MGKTVNPGKYNMAFCLVCNGEGKIAKYSWGFDVFKECGGFGFIKRDPEIFEYVENSSSSQRRPKKLA